MTELSDHELATTSHGEPVHNEIRQRFCIEVGPCEVRVCAVDRINELVGDDELVALCPIEGHPTVCWAATRPTVSDDCVNLEVEVARARREWPRKDAEAFRRWAFRITDHVRRDEWGKLGIRKLPAHGRCDGRLWVEINEAAMLREQAQRRRRGQRTRRS